MTKGRPERRVLNVGCGGDTYGTNRIDFAPGAAATEVGSVLALPYRDRVFDEVYGGNVLEHMPNPLQFVEECKRVLRPGGTLVLITDHAAYLGYHVRRSGLRLVSADYHQWHGHGGDRHFMLFTVGHLENLMGAAGLAEVRVTPFTKWKPDAFARLQARIVPWLTYAQLRVEAVRPPIK